MSEDSIKTSLLKLQEQLANTESVDPETLAIAQELEANIQTLLDKESESDVGSSVDTALSLEARFESEHPTTAAIVREIISALHKMGI